MTNPDEKHRLSFFHEKRWLLVSVIVIASGICSAYLWNNSNADRAESKPKTIRVAVMTWAGAGPGFVGIEKGFFGDVDVEISVIDDTRARQAAYQNGDFEVYLTNPDQHPREVENGLPGKMIMLSDISSGADGVIAHKEIKDIAALKGRKIAYTQGTASDFMLSQTLEAAGIRRNEVSLVTLDDPGTAIAALQSGGVDAAVSWEPLMTEAAEHDNVRILFTSADVPEMILGVFIAKLSLLDDPVRLSSFIDGWLTSIDYVEKHRPESDAIMAKAFHLTKVDVEGMMKGLVLADYDLQIEYFAKQPDGLTRLDHFVNNAASFWHSVGLLRKQPAPDSQWVPPRIASYFESKQ